MTTLLQPASLRFRLLQEETAEITLADYIEDIKNEIQALLNDIASIADVPQEYQQLRRSLLTYGLPAAVRWSSVESFQDAHRLHELAALLMRNDPRIEQCQIHLQDIDESVQSIQLIIVGQIKFYRKQARLQLNAICQPIQRRFYLL